MHNESEAEGIIYGKNAVIEFLKSGRKADTLFVAAGEGGSLNYIVALAKEADVLVKAVHPIKLARLCGSERHQGVALSCQICAYAELDEVFARAAQSGRPPFFVIADGIEDPHNLGAMIRSAECAGVHGVIIPERRGCAITPAVYRASAGACGHMPIVRAGNLPAIIRDLKQRGVFCYGADADGQSCYSVDLTGAAALVIGSEGTGLSRLVGDLCDQIISLPLHGSVGSLNASVAAGILMYEYVRQSSLKEAIKP